MTKAVHFYAFLVLSTMSLVSPFSILFQVPLPLLSTLLSLFTRNILFVSSILACLFFSCL